jgi:hypothetical protein
MIAIAYASPRARIIFTEVCMENQRKTRPTSFPRTGPRIIWLYSIIVFSGNFRLNLAMSIAKGIATTPLMILAIHAS